jgi:hypothetical protein
LAFFDQERRPQATHDLSSPARGEASFLACRIAPATTIY